MNSESRQCQNCRRDFVIESDDFAFYEKIKVPPPTFCPECRLQRRLTFFQLFNLFKRKCDLCGKEIISLYRGDWGYKVYCVSCWWSDKWDPLDYGKDYDFSRPLFAQFNELLHRVPRLGLEVDNTNVNSPYINSAGHVKNSYLIFFADYDEDCSYGFYLVGNKSVLDSSFMSRSEFCYDSMHSHKNNGCVGLRSRVTESIDCFFLKDCDNCQNCFASANLKNKKYHIFNKPYSKEEYFREISKWDLGSHKTYQEVKRMAEEHWEKQYPRPYFMDFAVNCTGDYIFESKNCENSFEVIGAEDSKYLMLTYIAPTKSSYDITGWGNNLSLSYEGAANGENASNLRFTQGCGLNGMDMEYCSMCFGGSHLFGCASMKKGEYCILNKKYSESEFRDMREKIVKQMNEIPYRDKKGNVYKYGEFFPIEMSMFPYNLTFAQNFFPLDGDAALKNGFVWSESVPSEHKISKEWEDVPDHVKDAGEDILEEVIGCKNCGKGFKIIESELKFLRARNLPLPRACPFCRIKEKFHIWVSEMRSLERRCDRCQKIFGSHYTEAEAPKILCKECYLEQLQ